MASGPLFILPPFAVHGGLLGKCQAAISVPRHASPPHRPLPRWRYCSFCGDNLEGAGVLLCGVHRNAAARRGTERLLPELRVWQPPRQHGRVQ